MKLGLISDTHGRFDPLLAEVFAGVDAILHAGDVVGEDVLQSLRELAPVEAVAGNNDLGTKLPEALVVTFGRAKILILHDIGRPDRLNADARARIAAAKPNIVMSGHSHKPHALVLDGILFVNPGSAGPRRFSLPRAAGILEIHGNEAKATVASLEEQRTLAAAELTLNHR